MTEIEALRKERDDLYQQYLKKDEEVHEYTRKQESSLLEDLNKECKSKIIQVRQWDYSLSPAGKREREDDYQIIFVEEVTNYNWLKNEMEITGTVLELFGDTTYLDVADHISDSDLEKFTVKIYRTNHLRVKRDDVWLLSEDDVSATFGEFDYAFEQIQDKFWKAVRGKKCEAEDEQGSN